MSFLNSYETVYILKPDVTESLNLSTVNYYKSLLKEKGATHIIVQQTHVLNQLIKMKCISVTQDRTCFVQDSNFLLFQNK